jgi:hypothetical protein
MMSIIKLNVLVQTVFNLNVVKLTMLTGYILVLLT